MGNLYQARRVEIALLGIRANRHACIDDSISYRDVGDAVADRFNDSRRFAAETHRQVEWIQACSMIGIDQVEADHGMPDLCFAGSRFREINLFPLEDLGSTVFV